jgi:hypothetical protein
MSRSLHLSAPIHPRRQEGFRHAGRSLAVAEASSPVGTKAIHAQHTVFDSCGDCNDIGSVRRWRLRDVFTFTDKPFDTRRAHGTRAGTTVGFCRT